MAVFNVTVATSIFSWTEVTVGGSTVVGGVCSWLLGVVDTVVSAGTEEGSGDGVGSLEGAGDGVASTELVVLEV
jgi:hypothetical protein